MVIGCAIQNDGVPVEGTARQVNGLALKTGSHCDCVATAVGLRVNHHSHLVIACEVVVTSLYIAAVTQVGRVIGTKITETA